MPEELTNEQHDANVEAALVDYYNTTTPTNAATTEIAEAPAATPEVAPTETLTTPVPTPEVVPEVVPVIVEPEFIPSSTAVDLEGGGFEVTLGTDSPLTEKDLDHIFAVAEKRGLDKEETLALIHQQETFLEKGKNFGRESGKQSVMEEAKKVLKAQEDAYNADTLFSSASARTANEAKIDNVLKKYGTPEFQKAFLGSHLKNDVALAKFLHNIGMALEGDEMRMSGTGVNAPKVAVSTEEERLRAAYPEHYKN